MNKEILQAQIEKAVAEIPRDASPIRPLPEYAHLVQDRTWQQRWNPTKRELEVESFEISGRVWSDAIDASLAENNAVYIPEMAEPLYLDRSIVIGSGARIVAHPRTEIRMISGDVEYCLIRNRNLVSGQQGPVELCQGADRNILIEGGIWSDQKNNGAGPQGFRKGKKGLMLGSQGAIVLSNVEDVTIRGVTVKDNSSFGVQIGNARRFLVDNFCVDGTKDGVHVEGPAEFGVIREVNGPLAGDDVVALNAWDWRTSSLTFGSITDILVQDANVSAGSCAIRILPGVKTYPDGATEACDIARCIFSNIRNCHTFKIYDQPNIRCIQDDYSADLGQVAELYFDDIHVVPLDLTHHMDKSKTAVFELCEHATGLHFENIYLDYVPGGAYPEYLLSVGPKSCIRPIPFAASGTQEIFNPQACPEARDISFGAVYLRCDSDSPDLVPHSNPAALLNYSGAGTAVLEG